MKEIGVHNFKTHFSKIYKEVEIYKIESYPRRWVKLPIDIWYFIPIEKIKDFIIYMENKWTKI